MVAHPGAVGIVAHDGERMYFVRQPREAVGEQSLLELPAGKLEDEEPLETAKRELAEEIGKGAERWEYLTSFWTSPGFADEECHLYLATGLYDHSEDPDEDERIEIVTAPAGRARRRDPRLSRLQDPDRAPLVQGLRVLSEAVQAQGAPAGRAKPGTWPLSSARSPAAPTSTWCSTSSPTSSSSAGCRATRWRPTGATCSSSAATWRHTTSAR